MIHKVALVLDTSFGEKVAELAVRMHVWLIDSPENIRSAQQLWDEHASTYSPLGGITTFRAEDPTGPTQTFGSILPTIDEHHQGDIDIPAWSELHVYGLSPSDIVLSTLIAFDFNRVERTDFGFIAFADVSDG